MNNFLNTQQNLVIDDFEIRKIKPEENNVTQAKLNKCVLYKYVCVRLFCMCIHIMKVYTTSATGLILLNPYFSL